MRMLGTQLCPIFHLFSVGLGWLRDSPCFLSHREHCPLLLDRSVCGLALRSGMVLGMKVIVLLSSPLIWKQKSILHMPNIYSSFLVSIQGKGVWRYIRGKGKSLLPPQAQELIFTTPAINYFFKNLFFTLSLAFCHRLSPRGFEVPDMLKSFAWSP